MPAFIKVIVELEPASGLRGDDLRAAALFGWIGLMVSLIAVSAGEQGVWF